MRRLNQNSMLMPDLDGTPSSRKRGPRAVERGVWPVVALVGTGLYGYLLASVNLPEEWGYWLFGGAVLGLIVGRWYMLLGSLTPLVFLFTDSGGVDDELLGLLFLVYLPGALLAILSGIGVRRLIEARIGARCPRRSPNGPTGPQGD
jgi:hypothetical protein